MVSKRDVTFHAGNVTIYLKSPSKVRAILIALDQLLNVLLGGDFPDETLSSRCWRMYSDGTRKWPKVLVDTMFFWDKNHCLDSFLNERIGRQDPPEARCNGCCLVGHTHTEHTYTEHKHG